MVTFIVMNKTMEMEVRSKAKDSSERLASSRLRRPCRRSITSFPYTITLSPSCHRTTDDVRHKYLYHDFL